MKKIIYILFLFILLINNAKAIDLTPNCKSSILIDYDTSKILYEKDKDKRLPVASLTKIIGEIIILENIENNNLKWDELVKVSKNASNYGGTQIYLEANEMMSVEDLFKGISIASANDAMVALSERIKGNEENFVKEMNKKVKEYNLKNTNFVNVTGFDEDNNYSSSYDISIISKNLLKHKDILKYSSIYEDYLRKDTNNKFWLVNTNKLVRTYKGCDGLKTGFTNDSKYSIVVTAKQDNLRLIGVLLNCDDSKLRNKQAEELLNYGFNNYKVITYKTKNQTIKDYKINKNNNIKLKVLEDINILLNKSDNIDFKEKVTITNNNLPIKKNMKIGVLDIYKDNNIIKSIDLYSDRNVNKNNLLNIYKNNILSFIKGLK